jgi:hypothetical protein
MNGDNFSWSCYRQNIPNKQLHPINGAYGKAARRCDRSIRMTGGPFEKRRVQTWMICLERCDWQVCQSHITDKPHQHFHKDFAAGLTNSSNIQQRQSVMSFPAPSAQKKPGFCGEYDQSVCITVPRGSSCVALLYNIPGRDTNQPAFVCAGCCSQNPSVMALSNRCFQLRDIFELSRFICHIILDMTLHTDWPTNTMASAGQDTVHSSFRNPTDLFP